MGAEATAHSGLRIDPHSTLSIRAIEGTLAT